MHRALAALNDATVALVEHFEARTVATAAGAAEAFRHGRNLVVGAALAVVLLAFVLGWFVSRGVVRRVSGSASQLGRASEQLTAVSGRLTVASDGTTSQANVVASAGEQVSSEGRGRRRAFLAAARGGDLATLLRVLAPDVVRRSDPAALRLGGASEIRGARAVADETPTDLRRAYAARLALVDGHVGLIVAPLGRLIVGRSGGVTFAARTPVQACRPRWSG